MAEFHPITIEDKNWLRPILLAHGKKSCEYTFGNLYIWKDVSCIKVRQFECCALVRFDCDYPCYLFPFGCSDIKSAMLEIERDVEKTGHPLRIIAATPEEVREVERLFPGVYKAKPTPDYGEYIYNTADLAELAGKKYHQKRNFISRFVAQYPDYSFKRITENDSNRLLEMNERWFAGHTEGQTDIPKSIIHEHMAVTSAIENFGALDLCGGYIETNSDGIVAFSIGEPIDKSMFCVHIEKAFTNIVGSYAIINRDFVREFCGDYPFVNREDAAGIEGLIKAKLSYNPVEVTEKFEITRND